MNTLSDADRLLLQTVGKSILVLVALARLGQAGEDEIAMLLDIQLETARNHLRRLSKSGVVKRVRPHAGWRLTSQGVELLRPSEAFSAEIRGKDALLEANSINNSSPSLLSESINTISENATRIPRNSADSDRLVDNSAESGDKPGDKSGDKTGEGVNPEDRERILENQKMLKSLGVGEPKRSRLAVLAHVTPELIRRWHRFLEADRGGRYRTGLLIVRLESGEAPPPERGSEEERHAYLETSEYAEFIEH